ncbi:MAG: cupin domain-containing protein [Kiritimatiellae bacterium]|nr:cupin domain-containing protein [Kiritimatiellia bacterium]
MIRRTTEMREEVREKMRGGTGAVTIKHYFEKEEFGAKVRLCARLTLPPGASIGIHQHSGEDEIFLVLSGTGWLEEDGVRQRVSAGDAILTGKGGAHAIANAGDEDLVVVAIIVCYS